MNSSLVVIVGQMGVGKTTVGRLVAERLDVPFCDSDVRIEEVTGSTARELALHLGVAALHSRELSILRTAIDRPPGVIAAAASVVDSPAGRKAIEEATCVWIDRAPGVPAPPGRDHRRSVEADENLERRRPFFEKLADFVLTGPGTPEEYAASVVEFLSRSG